MKRTMAGYLIAAAFLLLTLSQSASAQTAPVLGKGQKQPIRGLVSMGDIGIILEPTKAPASATAEATVHPGIYSAVVIVAPWSHLAPAAGKYDFAQIDKALADIRAYNAKYPRTPVVGKLRIFGGPNAPDWVKALDGGPIKLTKRGNTLVDGKFWTVPYRDAWRDLQKHLAEKYDTDPLMQEVAISSCGSTSAEPFVASVQTENVAAFQAAGYTDEQLRACLTGALDDYAPWKRVALDFTINELRTLHTDGTITQSADFPLQVMDDFRARMGARGVVANHGLSQPLVKQLTRIVEEMRKIGPPIEFQTDGLKVDWDATELLAKDIGATEFEMWDSKEADGAAHVPYEQLKSWTKQFPYTNMLATQK